MPIALVFLQPDIGTALVYLAALAAVLFVAGVRWSHLAVLLGLTVACSLAVLWVLPAAGVNVLKPYQAARLTGFTHPSTDPQGATYNLRQSITAVGAGGLRGRGVLGATQTRLNYLPEHATDFAFASLAEERGFFGASILLLLYLLVVWRALEDRHDGARPLLCSRGRRDRIHVPVPGVREQRDDDGDRADHRHPAAVRLGRRLVDDHELPGDRDPPGDLPPASGTAARMKKRKMKLTPLSVISLVRELRRGTGDPRPLAVAGARELVPLLARELRAGGDPRRSSRARFEDAAILVWIGAPDEDELRRASRHGVPIIAVTEADTVPYVLATDLVRVPPGAGFPVDEIAGAVARRLGEDSTSLAARLPGAAGRRSARS